MDRPLRIQYEEALYGLPCGATNSKSLSVMTTTATSLRMPWVPGSYSPTPISARQYLTFEGCLTPIYPQFAPGLGSRPSMMDLESQTSYGDVCATQRQ